MLGLFGSIQPPPGISSYISKAGSEGGAIFLFISTILKLVGVGAGIYATIQLILAGVTYITGSGDSKSAEKAWTMIWQSLLGLFIVASAFTIATVAGTIFKINFLNPEITAP